MLFYHYRQYRLSRDSDIALLSYLAVDNRTRAASFRAISMLEKGVADNTDPFAAERAVRFARAGILDYLRAWCAAGRNVNVVPVDLIDLGAGSGLVAARLCGLIGSALLDYGRSPRFRIWSVDLLMSEPTRFFASEGIGQYIDSIEMIAADYRQCLAQGLALPACDGVRIALMSRFFNNLSDFDICSWKPEAHPGCAGELTANGASECMPAYCLAPDGPGPQQLVASNTRVWLDSGRAFQQYSLSPYFLSLRLSAGSNPESIRSEELRGSVHLPVRTFRPDCLVTQAGDSLLGELARQSTLVVVQDADMHPQVLKVHARKAHLEDLMVLDTTRAAGLRGHFSYLVASRTDPVMQHIAGERLW